MRCHEFFAESRTLANHQSAHQTGDPRIDVNDRTPGKIKRTPLEEKSCISSDRIKIGLCCCFCGIIGGRSQRFRGIAERIAPLGWHVQFLMHVDDYPDLEKRFDGFPTDIVIDSIQTTFSEGLDSAPGTISQVRHVAGQLLSLAKSGNIPVFLIGHVTKDGALAGPRVLEHMVDTVLYFEGERGHQFRILRTVKNRFGPTDEIGVFEMSDRGLSDVANPSALFLAERRGQVSGACVFAGIEGTRPVLVEIQALVSPSSLAGDGRARRGSLRW